MDASNFHHCSQCKTLNFNFGGSEFDPDLRIDFDAHRLKTSPLPKTKLQECEEY
jgi:hypothetical protein